MNIKYFTPYKKFIYFPYKNQDQKSQSFVGNSFFIRTKYNKNIKLPGINSYNMLRRLHKACFFA